MLAVTNFDLPSRVPPPAGLRLPQQPVTVRPMSPPATKKAYPDDGRVYDISTGQQISGPPAIDDETGQVLAPPDEGFTGRGLIFDGDVRDSFRKALSIVGGSHYFVRMALSATASDRSAFMSMAAKIIPQEVNARVSAEISVSTVNYADVTQAIPVTSAIAQHAAEMIMDVTSREVPPPPPAPAAPGKRGAALFN